MTTFRIMQSQELAEAARLADTVFRGDKKPSMAEMFPRLFAPETVHSYGAFAEDGSLAAFMGLAPSTLRVGGAASLRAFSLGSVCTAPEQRGAGLAGRLLEHCIAHARAAEAPLLFVSGGRSLYTRAGSASFGRALHAVLRPGVPAAGQTAAFPAPGSAGNPDLPSVLEAREALLPVRLREAGPEDLERLHELHDAGGTIFEDSAAGLGEQLRAASYSGVLGLSPRVILAEVGREILAYAAIGIPELAAAADGGSEAAAFDGEPPTVIGYGGEAAYVARLLADLLGYCELPELHIRIPWQEYELQLQLRQAGVMLEEEPNAGTVLVTDVRMLLDQASGLWPLPWQEALRVDEEGRVFAASSDRELSREQWYSLLFSPERPQGADLPGWFSPIPLPYLYGLHYV
ncbi:hypothetical protein CDO73_00835 [Saccharibacillus sp. O23]|uniref:GNAT family N-acetyltransferase n=1 Tax=Saccharibacillus sp. O23 TaxID=2009338 RepID=UPI000B4E3CBF|nr:GNAT family N-acetyltransferase [Saccharibacillus sp. O23]OWR33086.1 hypothetical protein CDO73_00835 [Saccharibacillus sp. O23]